jgi:hypothetical protein
MAPGKVNPLSFAAIFRTPDFSNNQARRKEAMQYAPLNPAGIKKAAPALDVLRPRVVKSRDVSMNQILSARTY